MATLYDLTEDYLRLLELAEDPEIDEEVVADTLEGLEGEIEYKADGYCKVIRELEAKRDMLTIEAERMAARASVISNNINRIKDNLMTSMIAMGKKKIDGELFKVTVAKNGGKAPVSINAAKVPIEYGKVTIKPDTDLIRKALESGEVLDFAHIEERGMHLRIK